MKYVRCFNLSLVVLAALMIGRADAQKIGVNFGADDAGSSNAASLAPGDVAGVVPQANWNNASLASGSITDAIDDSGTATTLDVAWASEESWSGVGGTPLTGDGVLVNSWISENGGDAAPSTITVSEIPYDLYDLYIYVGHDRADEDTSFSETGGAFTDFVTLEDVTGVTVAADPFVFNEITTSGSSGNYFLASGLSQDSLGIEFSVANGQRAPVNGFQIVLVPEPSSLVLLSMAGLMFGHRLRRRKSA
jgi:hypothetical protein